jgi:SAM-dependent methyltransferase
LGADESTPLNAEVPRHGYDSRLESSTNLFAAQFGHLSDEAWYEVLRRSQTESIVDGVEFPAFPEDELQSLIHGASGEQALAEAVAFHRYCREHAFESATPAQECRFLDFGCGWGRISRPFIRDFAPGQMYGYEPNYLFCVIARSLNPHLCVLHGERTPRQSLPPSWFDLVVGFSVFTHLPRNSAVAWLREISQSLRPGGLCVITTFGRRYLLYLVDLAAQQRQGLAIHWHAKSCIELAGDLHERIREFDAGRFVFLGESPVYGDAMVSVDAMREMLDAGGNRLELMQFDDEALSQDVLVLRRSTEGA